MKYLITGGAGFIGSNFCEYMIDKYQTSNFVCLDALTYAGCMDNLQNVIHKPNFKFVHGNICNERLIDTLFKEEMFDIVINFAAESHVEKSIYSPDIFVETNVKGVQILLDACKKYNVKRFHQISTDEVYGELPLNDQNIYFYENSPLNASTPYSASKASADLLTMSYFKTFGLPITISRSPNNYGKYQHTEKLIPLTIKNALNNNDILIHGTGEYIRDWLHVLDHCKGIDLIIHNGKCGEIYNIGSHTEKTNLEVVHKILDTLDIKAPLVKHVANRPGQDSKYAIDYTKIATELGYTPTHSFDTEIVNTINWYKNNPKWLGR